jgi:4-hydroxy-tetrahydrodipicolinate synthase
MITPFTDDNKIDFKAVRHLTEWYIALGCNGIFAVCQSSEMFLLSETEKLDLARAVKDAAMGRVKVIASGHTQDSLAEQIEGLGRMAETGVDAVVLVSNRLAGKDEEEEIFLNNFDAVLRQLPQTVFGMYECPYPYLRLLSTEFLKECGERNRLRFLKDVSCSLAVQKERAAAVADTPLALFNANTATLLDSLLAGYDGYNGVMGNFHIDLYRWLFDHYKTEPEKAREISDFLTAAGLMETRAYPVSAKYHCNLEGVSMGLHTRARDKSVLNENARRETESLFRLEKIMRKQLCTMAAVPCRENYGTC